MKIFLGALACLVGELGVALGLALLASAMDFREFYGSFIWGVRTILAADVAVISAATLIIGISAFIAGLEELGPPDKK